MCTEGAAPDRRSRPKSFRIARVRVLHAKPGMKRTSRLKLKRLSLCDLTQRGGAIGRYTTPAGTCGCYYDSYDAGCSNSCHTCVHVTVCVG